MSDLKIYGVLLSRAYRDRSSHDHAPIQRMSRRDFRYSQVERRLTFKFDGHRWPLCAPSMIADFRTLRPKSVPVQFLVATDVAKVLAEQLPIAVRMAELQKQQGGSSSFVFGTPLNWRSHAVATGGQGLRGFWSPKDN